MEKNYHWEYNGVFNVSNDIGKVELGRMASKPGGDHGELGTDGVIAEACLHLQISDIR